MIAVYSDIVVLGGGPGGCCLAINLARSGRSVTILERSAYDTRQLGNTLSPLAQQLLSEMRLSNALNLQSQIESPGIVSLWGDGGISEFDFLYHPYGSALHVERARFDAELASAAEAQGARIHRDAKPIRIVRTRTNWIVSAEIGGRHSELSSAWLIDATGRSNWLGHQLRLGRHAADRLVGLISEFEPATVTDLRLYVEALADGWIYVNHLPNGRAIAGLMTDGDQVRSYGGIKRFWEQELCLSKMVCPRFPELKTMTPKVVSASTAWLPQFAGDGWIAIGDAAISRDPLCGCGIDFAVSSGLAATRAILDSHDDMNLAIRSYQLEMETQMNQTLHEQRRMYRQVAKWDDHPFWQRRHGDVSSVAFAHSLNRP